MATVLSLTPCKTLSITSTPLLSLSLGVNSAIVNAANVGCLGGGGVDGAITHKGGARLRTEREALPVLGRYRGGEIRCKEGSAVVTGRQGELYPWGSDFCIHAVGPNYWNYEGLEEKADKLLQGAYTAALSRAKEVSKT